MLGGFTSLRTPSLRRAVTLSSVLYDAYCLAFRVGASARTKHNQFHMYMPRKRCNAHAATCACFLLGTVWVTSCPRSGSEHRRFGFSRGACPEPGIAGAPSHCSIADRGPPGPPRRASDRAFLKLRQASRSVPVMTVRHRATPPAAVPSAGPAPHPHLHPDLDAEPYFYSPTQNLPGSISKLTGGAQQVVIRVLQRRLRVRIFSSTLLQVLTLTQVPNLTQTLTGGAQQVVTLVFWRRLRDVPWP